MELMELGREKYTISCVPCHGGQGDGNGVVKYFGISAVKSLHDPDVVKQSDGDIYRTITVGKGVMKGYANTLSVEDRWAIVAYLEALQGTQEGGARQLWGAAPAVDQGGPVDEDPLVAKGRELHTSKTCIACHSLDGTKLVSGSFLGLAGTERKFTDGTTAIADEAYLRESIKNPNAKVVEGYAPGLMVIPPITDEETDALVAFIMSLKQ